MRDEDKTKEQLIRELNELRVFKHVLDQLPICTVIYDPSEKLVYRNRATKIIDGYDDGELLGFSNKEYLSRLQISPSKCRPETLSFKNSEKSRFPNGTHGLTETTLTAKNGVTKNILLNSNFIYDGENNLLGVSSCCVDVTEYARIYTESEYALRLSEERFYKAFNGSPNPMTIIKLEDAKFIEVNDCFTHIYGYTRKESIGKTAIELNLWAKPEDRLVMIKALNQNGGIRNLECQFRIKSGKIRFGLLSAQIIYINGDKCVLTEVNDITERKYLEKEMARLERLNLVGEMAAAIGHEVRNPMTTVRGFLQVIGRKREFSSYKEYFSLMIDELDRANSIITEFLSLSSNKQVDFSINNLKTVFNTLSPLITADANESNVDVVFEMDDIPDFTLSEKEIRQVIFNLVHNGIEAMKQGGKLTIRTFTNNGEVVLSVQDEGPGIAHELIDKIGTPFFTTKDKGTGLGLAVCYRIAERHNATISFDTGPAGTTFFVRFRILN